MAVVDFGVVIADVQKYVAQWRGKNAPLSHETDITGEWIPVAASEINAAMLIGGLSITDANTSATYPVAYQICQHHVALRAALYFISALSNQDTDKDKGKSLNVKWKTSNDFIAGLKAGDQLGELTSTTGKNVAKFYHGTTSEAELDAARATFNEKQ